jgi:hypothetical protein
LGAPTDTHNQPDQQLRPIVPPRANAPIDWPGAQRTVAAPRHPRQRCGGGRLDPSKRCAGRRRGCGVSWRGQGRRMLRCASGWPISPATPHISAVLLALGIPT